jgi:hypothetical protein
MLDFRRNSQHRNDLARQGQRRVMALVLMLGITVILIGQVRDPTFWRRLDRMFTPPQERADGNSIDNRLETAAADSSFPDRFVIARDREPVAAAADGDQFFPGVESADLSAVRDDAPSTRNEQACLLRLLDILQQTDSKSLGKASLGPVSYAQLFRQPDQYRGRLVSISGIVRRVERLDVFPNKYGIKQYYQTWLWPSDNPAAPIVVLCLNLPPGFPTEPTIAEQAEVTGFFFKRWAYQAQDSFRTAPTLLARGLRWQKQPAISPVATAATVEAWPVSLVVGVSALVAMLIAWYVYLRTRPPREQLPDRPPDFTILEDLERK